MAVSDTESVEENSVAIPRDYESESEDFHETQEDINSRRSSQDVQEEQVQETKAETSE
jgi:hypothetical protein